MIMACSKWRMRSDDALPTISESTPGESIIRGSVIVRCRFEWDARVFSRSPQRTRPHQKITGHRRFCTALLGTTLAQTLPLRKSLGRRRQLHMGRKRQDSGPNLSGNIKSAGSKPNPRESGPGSGSRPSTVSADTPAVSTSICRISHCPLSLVTFTTCRKFHDWRHSAPHQESGHRVAGPRKRHLRKAQAASAAPVRPGQGKRTAPNSLNCSAPTKGAMRSPLPRTPSRNGG